MDPLASKKLRLRLQHPNLGELITLIQIAPGKRMHKVYVYYAFMHMEIIGSISAFIYDVE